MKLLFLSSWLIIVQNLNAQIPYKISDPLKIEWKKDLTSGYPSVSGLVLTEKKIYATQTGDQAGSAFNIISIDGFTLFSSTTYARIRSFFKFDDWLYSMGDERITRRDVSGNIVEEKTLTLSENGNISSRNGKILNGKVYATHINSYFLKFSLTGEQLFKKVIGSSVNHMLEVGGDFIYIYSTIYNSNPDNQLMQYDTLGNQKWSLQVGDVRAMLADEQGNCYVAPVEVESTLIKYNTDGDILWSRPVIGQFIEGMSKRGDSIFVCGRLKLGSPENQLCAYSIVSASTGEILQQQSFSIYQPASVPEYFSHIASDGKNIYVGGKYGWPGQGEKCFLIKLSKEGNTTSIKEETNSKTSFSIFPNPGGSQFSISCGQSDVKSLNVTVRNISGQVVYKKQISCNDQKTFTLDLGKQTAGNYSVEIVSGKDKTVKKIVVE